MERGSLLCVLEGSLDVRVWEGLCVSFLLAFAPFSVLYGDVFIVEAKYGEEFWYLSFYKAKRVFPSLLSAVALESFCMLKCWGLFCVLQSYGQHLFIFLHFISTSSMNS